MTKRPSLAGRGADFFLGGEKREPADNLTSTPAQRRASNNMYPKATYYLPPGLQERLEDLWMQKRKENRKVTKSDMVREALEEYLKREAR